MHEFMLSFYLNSTWLWTSVFSIIVLVQDFEATQTSKVLYIYRYIQHSCPQGGDREFVFFLIFIIRMYKDRDDAWFDGIGLMGLVWMGLDALDWMHWIDWIDGIGWIGLDGIALDWIGSDRIGLYWIVSIGFDSVSSSHLRAH